MKIIFWAFILFGLSGLAPVAAAKDGPLETVPSVDLQRYMGTWYEISAFPQRFEKGCHCTTAEYEMTDKGYVRVINSCRKDIQASSPAFGGSPDSASSFFSSF